MQTKLFTHAGGQGGQGRGRVGAQGLPGVGSTGQLAADLAQRMSDQARGAFQVNLQQQNGPGGQQSVDASQHSGHLFASIATWLNRLNDAGGSRSWPNIELPYPDYGGGESSFHMTPAYLELCHKPRSFAKGLTLPSLGLLYSQASVGTTYSYWQVDYIWGSWVMWSASRDQTRRTMM